MSKAMGRFWDRRAREDPYFFVDTRLGYRKPDLERFWRQGESDLDAVLDALGVSIAPGDAVVEIGCGVGRLTRVIATRAATVSALDVSAEMLAKARRHHPDLDNVEWLAGDGASLAGVAEASADACISYVVFQHIPDPAVTLAYVREMGRVLRPGGWAAFQVSNDPGLHRPAHGWPRRALRAIAALTRRGPRGQRHPAWLGSAVQIAELREAADAGGMELERVLNEGSQYCLVLARRRGPDSA